MRLMARLPMLQRVYLTWIDSDYLYVSSVQATRFMVNSHA